MTARCNTFYKKKTPHARGLVVGICVLITWLIANVTALPLWYTHDIGCWDLTLTSMFWESKGEQIWSHYRRTGIIMCMDSTNESRRYNVVSLSLDEPIHRDSPNVSEVVLKILEKITCTQPQHGAKNIHTYLYLPNMWQNNSIYNDAARCRV